MNRFEKASLRHLLHSSKARLTIQIMLTHTVADYLNLYEDLNKYIA